MEAGVPRAWLHGGPFRRKPVQTHLSLSSLARGREHCLLGPRPHPPSSVALKFSQGLSDFSNSSEIFTRGLGCPTAPQGPGAGGADPHPCEGHTERKTSTVLLSPVPASVAPT